MTVVIFRVVDVLKPLLELSPLANLEWWKFLPQIQKFLPERYILAEDFGGFRSLPEEIPKNTVVYRRAGAKVAVLRGKGRAGHPPVLIGIAGILHQEVRKKSGRAIHQRIGFLEKFFVARELIMFPKMSAKPGAGERPIGD